MSVRPQSARHLNSTIKGPVAINAISNNSEQQQQQQQSLETIEDEIFTDELESCEENHNDVTHFNGTGIEGITSPVYNTLAHEATPTSHSNININTQTPSSTKHRVITVNSETSNKAATAENIAGKFDGVELERLDAAKKQDSNNRTTAAGKHRKHRSRKTRKAKRKNAAAATTTTTATAAGGDEQDDCVSDAGHGTRGATGVKSHTASSGFQLMANENSDIKNWLRRKNKQLRRKRAEERKKARQRKLEEMEKQKEALARKELSAEKVKNWMNEKKMEEKLLRQRVESTAAEQTALASKVTAVINQTFELQLKQQQTDGRQKPISVNVTTRDNTATAATAEQNALMAETRDVNDEHVDGASVAANMSVRQNQRTPTRLSAKTVQQDVRHSSRPHQMRANSSRVAAAAAAGGGGGGVGSGSPRVLSPRQSFSPTRVSFPSENDGELKLIVQRTDDLRTRQRISYDDWLAKKLAADETRRREIARQRQQRAAQAASDPVMADIVHSVARRRIEVILEGKKRIDTGLGRKFDDNASEYPKTRVRNLYRLLGDTERSDGGRAAETKSRRDEKSFCESVEMMRDSPASAARGDGKGSGGGSMLHSWRPALVDMSAGFHPRIDESLGRPSSAAAFPCRPTSPRRGGSSPVPDTLQRPTTAQPYRLHPTTRAINNDVTSSHQVENRPLSSCRSLTVTRLQAVTPRPNLPPTNAYGHVTYQQKSWEKFADFVWDKVNEAEGGKMVEAKMEERPEPIGSERLDYTADSNQEPASIPAVPAIGLVTGSLRELEPTACNDDKEDFSSYHSNVSNNEQHNVGVELISELQKQQNLLSAANDDVIDCRRAIDDNLQKTEMTSREEFTNAEDNDVVTDKNCSVAENGEFNGKTSSVLSGLGLRVVINDADYIDSEQTD